MSKEYERQLDEFYQIETTDYFVDKLKNNPTFFEVWDTMMQNPEEAKRLKALFGTEFNHIENHYKKIKNNH